MTEFLNIFSSFGSITQHTFHKDKTYGLVNYEKHEDAVRAVEQANQKLFQGKLMYVSRAQTKTDRKSYLKELHGSPIPSPRKTKIVCI